MMNSPRRVQGRRVKAMVALLAAASVGISACGSDDSDSSASAEPVAEDEIAAALEEPTELTFWTWVPDIEKEVALFEKKYPAIDVKVVNAGPGRAAVHQAADRA